MTMVKKFDSVFGLPNFCSTVEEGTWLYEFALDSIRDNCDLKKFSPGCGSTTFATKARDFLCKDGKWNEDFLDVVINEIYQALLSFRI